MFHVIEERAVRRRVAALMIDYGLKGYSVRVAKLKGEWAHCNFDDREIVMSRALLDTDWILIDQVARHEVAHGLAGRKAGHSKRWLETARAMGYRLGVKVPYVPVEGLHKWVERCETGMHSAIKYERGKDGLYCGPCHEDGAGLVEVFWEAL
jgi:hypothetical protein